MRARHSTQSKGEHPKIYILKLSCRYSQDSVSKINGNTGNTGAKSGVTEIRQ